MWRRTSNPPPHRDPERHPSPVISICGGPFAGDVPQVADPIRGRIKVVPVGECGNHPGCDPPRVSRGSSRRTTRPSGRFGIRWSVFGSSEVRGAGVRAGSWSGCRRWWSPVVSSASTSVACRFPYSRRSFTRRSKGCPNPPGGDGADLPALPRSSEWVSVSARGRRALVSSAGRAARVILQMSWRSTTPPFDQGASPMTNRIHDAFQGDLSSNSLEKIRDSSLITTTILALVVRPELVDCVFCVCGRIPANSQSTAPRRARPSLDFSGVGRKLAISTLVVNSEESPNSRSLLEPYHSGRRPARRGARPNARKATDRGRRGGR